MFKLRSDFTPTGDQPRVIKELSEAAKAGKKEMTLLGVTGSGKTYTLANLVEKLDRPTLVVSHNKTLAAQLYNEFKELFPDNAVEYFVSYYDYYQPEAYIPQSDTYIGKESEINKQIEKLRYSAVNSLLTRRDVLVVASVSCIYGVGIAPEDYQDYFLMLQTGQQIQMEEILDSLVNMGYERGQFDMKEGTFRLRGDVVDVFAPGWENSVRISMFGDEVEELNILHPLTGKTISKEKIIRITPAKLFLSTEEDREWMINAILEELADRIKEFEDNHQTVEAYRLKQRTEYDMEMLEQFGYCQGIENYTRYLSKLEPGAPPYTLMDYFPDDFLLIVDESHVTLPQVRGMFNGEKARKKNLIDYGWRLPSAYDNRPLNFDEFRSRINQVIYSSATPSDFELEHSEIISEMVVRPTGLLDPEIIIKPVDTQVDDLIGRVREVVEHGGKILVGTLTKRLAQELTDYFQSLEIRARYLHSGIDTLERIEILNDLQDDKFDVLIGINLLREGLDLPQVEMVAILDADKEGFLRSKTSLIQTIGRAARNVNSKIVLYADKMTNSIKGVIEDNERKRAIQMKYNEAHGITPETTIRKTKASMGFEEYHDFDKKKKKTKGLATRDFELINMLSDYGIIQKKDDKLDLEELDFHSIEDARKQEFIRDLRKQMIKLANLLEFEKAALIRDKIKELEED